MSPITSDRITPLDGLGTVGDVPHLADGFRETFASYLVDTGSTQLHAVIGGSGAPLLLIAGWPQSWYAWRHLMPALSERFTVIAVDTRGQGRSAKPADGYDMDTLADDVLAMMDVLGHDRFSLVGHDAGMMVGYAMAVKSPDRVERAALGECRIPGVSPSPPLIMDDGRMSERLWHFAFNRVSEVNELLVEGREHIYFDYQFRTKAATTDGIPKYARDHYVDLVRQPGALHASFNFYRAMDKSIVQARRHMQTRLTMPVLSFAGAMSLGPLQEQELRILADDVTAVIIPGSGHYPAEEQPEALLSALTDFLTA